MRAPTRWSIGLGLMMVALGTWSAGVARAAEIKVLSSGAVRTVLSGLAQDFRKETGHTVTLAFAEVDAVRDRVTNGEQADLVIMTDVAVNTLAAVGFVAPDIRNNVARGGIGVGIRDGAPLPDISTVDALKRTLLAAKSLVYVDPALGSSAGLHFSMVLQRLGIADAVSGKTILQPDDGSAAVVANGQAELSIQPMHDIVAQPGVRLVGPLPRDVQKTTTYTAAPLTQAGAPDVARQFIAFLARPESKAKFAAAGLDYEQ